MMTVPTYVGPSTIEGVGLFAAAPIKAGDVIWQLNDRLDVSLTQQEIAGLPQTQREFIERYGYRHMTRPQTVVVECDNGRFMNHSANPNTIFDDPETGWAKVDIAEGEELTCNYAEFDPGFQMQPGRQFAAVVEQSAISDPAGR